MSADLSNRAYIRILSLYLAFYEEAEATRRCFQHSPDLSFQPELQLLREDLCWQKRLPTTQQLRIETSSQALGMLYVLYGSRFGAKVIHKNLRMTLPTHEHKFFSSCSEQHRWLLLLVELEAHGAHDAQLLEIIAGAEATFSAFDTAMLVP